MPSLCQLISLDQFEKESTRERDKYTYLLDALVNKDGIDALDLDIDWREPSGVEEVRK
jgi:hypothetical protein